MTKGIEYLSGFGNQFETEALRGTLPVGQNSPQKVSHGLYAEQLNGSAFTAPRHGNLRSWLYRIRPSVLHSAYKLLKQEKFVSERPDRTPPSPNQMRWDPPVIPSKPTDFLNGITTWAVSGASSAQAGMAVHLYACNQSMKNRSFYDADGEILIVPQLGGLQIKTEFGILEIAPTEIAVIPRGVKFQVELTEATASGYLCENFGMPLRLPNLGPIGANGLAHPRDFLYPVAAYEEKKSKHELIAKYQGHLWSMQLGHSPFDVVAWHGNYAPYKYDLKRFQTVNTVSFDHSDPSIFTVLTSPSEIEGTANLDFVIFPPRWAVAEHTFRPPYFHRNIMSEYMGLIHGVYDAKEEGFVPGGGSLHNCMSAHGPEAAVFEKASNVELKPQYMDATLAFMFESRLPFLATPEALGSKLLQKNYLECWQGLKAHFDPKNGSKKN